MPYTITYNFVDAKNEEGTTDVNLPDATSYADVLIFAAEFGTLLVNIMNGQVRYATVSSRVDIAGAAALTDSDIEEGARFQYETTNGFYTSMRVPTIMETLIQPTSREVDQLDPDITALTGAMTSGLDLVGAGGSGVISPCDKRGEDIIGLTQAREQFLSSRRSR